MKNRPIAGFLVLVLLHYRKQESRKKNAQARLENEKQQILKKLSQKIINKFEPITKQQEAAIYAVKKKENEDYHLAQYKYAKCMSDNAYKIVVDDYSCEKKKSSKPKSKKRHYLVKIILMHIKERD
jgi:hypothetical protein